MSELPNRRRLISEDFGPFTVSLGYDPSSNSVCEVWFSYRGKPGHDLDNILYEIGVHISKHIQGEFEDDTVEPIKAVG